MSEYLTIIEVCELLKLSERTVYDLCRRGQIAGAAKIGNQWRVDRRKLRAWLAEGGAAAVASPPEPEPEPDDPPRGARRR